jgi:hydroxypyruvate reductase
MAQGVLQRWADELGRIEGLIVAPAGPDALVSPFHLIRAGHPIPDDSSVQAGERALSAAAGLGPDDMMLALLSGGGSALLAVPAPGLTLEDKRAATRILLHSGAPIAVVNAVRRRLSSIKGGRLAAAAAPARVLSLIISDVAGDDASAVASGPTAADAWTNPQVLAALRPYRAELPAAVWARLSDPASESPALEVPADLRIVARAADALDAAAAEAQRLGLRVVHLGDRVEGEARAVAFEHAALIRRLKAQAGDAPLIVLSGGETTVTVRGAGRGGPNSEYLLALALALEGEPGVHALAADTDGADGVGGAAGAIIGPDTLARAARADLSPAASLDANDALTVFERLGDAVVTGPTGVNVNDFRAVLIGPSEGGQAAAPPPA